MLDSSKYPLKGLMESGLRNSDTWGRGQTESSFTCPYMSINTANTHHPPSIHLVYFVQMCLLFSRASASEKRQQDCDLFSCYSLSDTWVGRAFVHPNEEPNLFPDLSVLYFSATLMPFWPGMLYSKKVLIGTGRTLSSFTSIRRSPEKETNLCRGRLKVLDWETSIVDK